MARYRDHKPLDQKKWSFDGLHPTQVPEGNHYKHLEPHKPGAPEIEPSKMMHDDDDDFDLAAVERERKREAYVAKLESELASMKRAVAGLGDPLEVAMEVARAKATTTTTTTPAAVVVAAAASKKKEEESGAFYTLVPIRPRRRGERRSLRTFPGASLRPTLGFNTRPQRLSTPSDAFQLHPDVRLYRTALRVGETDRRHDREDVVVGERVEARAREETQARQAPRGEGSERSDG
jgi:hypothetical protein